MKFGFFFMPLHQPDEDTTLAIQSDLDNIVLAEKLGYDEVWIGEHHTGGWESVASPEMLLAAASQLTSRITLGTGVLTAPFHNPVQVAERICLLDHLCRGRLVIGMGAGLIPTDILMFGLDSKVARERLAESVEILVQLLHTDDPVNFSGQHYQIADTFLQLRPYQDRLRLALTTSGPASSSTTLAAKYSLGMISGNFFGSSGTELGTHYDALEKAAGSSAPDRADWRVATYVYVAETRQQAFDEIRAGAEAFVKDYILMYVPQLRSLFEDYVDQPLEEISVEQIADKAHWIIGDPDDVTAKISQLEKDTGGMGTLMIIGGGFSSHFNWQKNMDILARYVTPRFRGSNRGMHKAFDRASKNPVTLGSI